MCSCIDCLHCWYPDSALAQLLRQMELAHSLSMVLCHILRWKAAPTPSSARLAVAWWFSAALRAFAVDDPEVDFVRVRGRHLSEHNRCWLEWELSQFQQQTLVAWESQRYTQIDPGMEPELSSSEAAALRLQSYDTHSLLSCASWADAAVDSVAVETTSFESYAFEVCCIVWRFAVALDAVAAVADGLAGNVTMLYDVWFVSDVWSMWLSLIVISVEDLCDISKL